MTFRKVAANALKCCINVITLSKNFLKLNSHTCDLNQAHIVSYNQLFKHGSPFNKAGLQGAMSRTQYGSIVKPYIRS